MMRGTVGRDLIFCILFIVGVAGLCGGVVTHFVLRRMRKEAEQIHGSEHRLMKLIKSKYEHANLLTDRIRNVDVFVDKYLYEYRILGVRLYGWMALPLRMLWLSLVLGCAGCALYYYEYGITEVFLQIFAFGSICVVVLFLVHVMSRKDQKVRCIRTYIVDYLENVCAHRYVRPQHSQETVKRQTIDEQVEEVKKEVEAEKKETPSQEIRIREILEEFLA